MIYRVCCRIDLSHCCRIICQYANTIYITGERRKESGAEKVTKTERNKERALTWKGLVSPQKGALRRIVKKIICWFSELSIDAVSTVVTLRFRSCNIHVPIAKKSAQIIGFRPRFIFNQNDFHFAVQYLVYNSLLPLDQL